MNGCVDRAVDDVSSRQPCQQSASKAVDNHLALCDGGRIDPTVGVTITSPFLSGGDCMYYTIRTACKYSTNSLKTPTAWNHHAKSLKALRKLLERLHKLLANTVQDSWKYWTKSLKIICNTEQRAWKLFAIQHADAIQTIGKQCTSSSRTPYKRACEYNATTLKHYESNLQTQYIQLANTLRTARKHHTKSSKLCHGKIAIYDGIIPPIMKLKWRRLTNLT